MAGFSGVPFGRRAINLRWVHARTFCKNHSSPQESIRSCQNGSQNDQRQVDWRKALPQDRRESAQNGRTYQNVSRGVAQSSLRFQQIMSSLAKTGGLGVLSHQKRIK